ncbi:MAG: hypothetical protein ICV73_21950 [Acetobacteraceae bacterium]|nr:hypothetical protein [Acetobacteraceae bacterium]
MGVWDDLKAVVLAVHRLTQAEKQFAEQAAETRVALRAAREEPAILRDRRTRLEGLLEGQDSRVMTQAEAAARSAATLAVSRDIGSLRERLAAVEARRLPPPPETWGLAPRPAGSGYHPIPARRRAEETPAFFATGRRPHGARRVEARHR